MAVCLCHSGFLQRRRPVRYRLQHQQGCCWLRCHRNVCTRDLDNKALANYTTASSLVVQPSFPSSLLTTTTTTTPYLATTTVRWAATTSTPTRLLSPWLLTATRLTSELTWTTTSPQVAPTVVATTRAATAVTLATAMPTPIALMTMTLTASALFPHETTPCSITIPSTMAVLLPLNSRGPSHPVTIGNRTDLRLYLLRIAKDI